MSVGMCIHIEITIVNIGVPSKLFYKWPLTKLLGLPGSPGEKMASSDQIYLHHFRQAEGSIRLKQSLQLFEFQLLFRCTQ